MDRVRTALAQFGLADKEMSLYLCLLQTGTAPASSLSKRTGIVRSTTQYLCQQLTQKGLVRMTKKNNVYLYTVEPPEKLPLLLERQRREIDLKEKQIRLAVGELKQMMNPTSLLPTVEYFEGLEGVLDAYNQILRDIPENGEVLTYVRAFEPEESEAFIADAATDDPFGAFQEFIHGRVRKGIRARVLAIRGPQSTLLQARDAKDLRTTRFVDRFADPQPAAEILIYGDAMCSVTATQGIPFAFIVHNANTTGMHRSLFEMAWKSAL